jgi:hypothetical protein
MAKQILSKEDFVRIFNEELRKNKNLTYSQLLKIINKKYTTREGKPFTVQILADRARDAGLSGKLKATNKPLTINEIKKLSSKENIKLYNKGDISLDTFRQRAIDRGVAARRSPEQKAKRAKAQRERERRALKTEEGRARIKANRIRAKAKEYKLKGMDPPATTATEALWKDIVKTARENPGNGRFSIASGLKKSMDRENFFSDNIKIKDSITGKTFTFGKDIASKGDKLKNFINKNAGSFDVVNFQEVVKPYQQKKFIDSIPGLRNLINSQLIPGYNPGQAQNAFTVQHNLGRQRNPLKVSLAFLNDNVKEFRVKDAFERIYNNAKDPKTGTIKVTQKVKDAFKEYAKGISELDTVSAPSGATRGNRTFGQSLSLEEMLRKTKSEGTVLPRGVLKKVKDFESLLLDYAKTNKGNVCQLFLNKGGRVGFANGGAGCVTEVNEALKNDPKKLAQDINKTEGIANKVKNTGTKFLTALKENPNLLKGGLPGKIALGLGTVAAGVGAGALVKQFRNDDPSTYLTNDSQMEGMIIADVEQKGEEVDDNILLDNQFKLELAAAAGLTAPIAKGVYKTARGVGEAGPLPEGVGRTRAALGLSKGVLGKGLWALGAPIVALPSTVGYVAQDIRAGKDAEEIATNPLTYLSAAFMNPAVKALGKAGASRGLLGIASLGLAGTAAGAVALPAISIGAGLATLGTLGYQGYKLFTGKDRSDEDFFR